MPKEKKSQFSAIRFARSAARGTSIIVPILYGICRPVSAMTFFAASSTRVRRRSNSAAGADERDHDLGVGLDAFLRRPAAAASKIARTCIS